MHGGLNPGETSAVYMTAEAGIEQRGVKCHVPSSMSDIMPTLLSGLGLGSDWFAI